MEFLVIQEDHKVLTQSRDEFLFYKEIQGMLRESYSDSQSMYQGNDSEKSPGENASSHVLGTIEEVLSSNNGAQILPSAKSSNNAIIN